MPLEAGEVDGKLVAECYWEGVLEVSSSCHRSEAGEYLAEMGCWKVAYVSRYWIARLVSESVNLSRSLRTRASPSQI